MDKNKYYKISGLVKFASADEKHNEINAANALVARLQLFHTNTHLHYAR